METQQLFNTAGLIYAIIILIVVTILLKKGLLGSKHVIIISSISVILGLVLHAPLIPLQMQSLILGQGMKGVLPPEVLAAIIVLLILTSLVVGRVFCGYACPIGSAQELVYRLPTKKIEFKRYPIIILFHLIMTFIFFLGALYSFNLLGSIGVRVFFYLDVVDASILIFLALLVLGIFLYRPFCRFICPFGLFSSILANISLFRIGRDKGCEECGRCSKQCPTGEAETMSRGGDCFLCLRCIESCNFDSIFYRKRS